MNTKLTLSIKAEVIKQAKGYAKMQGRSLSNIVEEYLKSLPKKESLVSEFRLHPLTEELCGSVKLPDNKSYEEIIGEAKLEKYMNR